MDVASDRIARAIQEHDVWVAVAHEAIGWVEIADNCIAALYILPSFAHQGIGAYLLCLAEAAIYRDGYRIVHLEASQNALGFYLRKGYIRSGPQSPNGAYPFTKELVTYASCAV